VPEAQLKLWLVELLLAAEYMHSCKVLHRDLKGSNIFITADNDVQIGDFGLATYHDTGTEDKEDQSLVGTPHYMSPELLSQKGYSFTTDIW
jgi:serine/threonine protein kinase